MRTQCGLLLGGALCVATVAGSSPAGAEPPIWESDFSAELATLTGADDQAEEVTLSFSFPYGSNRYSSIFAGTNGAVALGGEGEACDYPSGDELIETDAPMLAPFWSDMDLDVMGMVFFNDFGDRAVFTWDEIGSFANETAPFTFQLQIHDDGTIIFGYNGISEINDVNIGTDVHVGLTEGNLVAFPREVDYTADAPFRTKIPNVLELFNYDPAEVFDLDMENIVFTPQNDGYLVALGQPDSGDDDDDDDDSDSDDDSDESSDDSDSQTPSTR